MAGADHAVTLWPWQVKIAGRMSSSCSALLGEGNSAYTEHHMLTFQLSYTKIPMWLLNAYPQAST